MHAPLLINDLAIVLVAAGLCAFAAHRLRLPLVLGYITAGILVGHHLFRPGLVTDPQSIETLGGLGVVFLIVSLGLDFSLSHLRRVGPGALVVGLLEIPLMLWAGYQAGGLLGWERPERIFLGAIVSVSSTTIIVKILSDLGRAHEPFARLIYAVLVVEDILAVLILAALSAIGTTGGVEFGHLLSTGLGVTLFLVLTGAIGSLVVPRIIRRFTRPGLGELLVMVLMGILFAVSLMAVNLGYSVALGAFIAGAIVGETREVKALARMVTPLRDVFGAVFFVSVGLSIDPASLAGLWAPILAVSSVVIVGKIAACSFGAFIVGREPRTALRAGIGLAQIGEFSFIIAQMGLTLGVVGERLFTAAVGASAVTAFLAPLLIRSSDRAVAAFERHAPAPLVTYMELYHRWVAGLTVPGAARQVWAVARRPLLQALLNLLAASGILFLARGVAVWLGGGGDRLAGPFGATAWTIAFLVAMPFLIATWRKVRAISLILAEGALMGLSLPQPRALALRSLLANTGSLVAGVLLAFWLLAATATFLPPVPVLLAATAFIAALTAVLYRWMVRFQASLQAGLQRLARQPSEEAGEDEAATLDLLRRYYPYGSGASEIVVPEGSAAEGRPLKDLALRTVTGATVIGIERAGARVEEIAATPLAAGDRLLVMGEEDQIARAREMLAAGTSGIISPPSRR